jgi:hypothetical protein
VTAAGGADTTTAKSAADSGFGNSSSRSDSISSISSGIDISVDRGLTPNCILGQQQQAQQQQQQQALHRHHQQRRWQH